MPPASSPRERSGVDVSRFQPPSRIDYPRLAESVSWLIARASYGTTPDPTCAAHVRRARDAGLDVGVYHFLRTSRQREAQLDVLLAQLDAAGIVHGDLAPVIDLEENTTNGDPWPGNASDDAAWLCGQLERECGVRPVIYVSPSDWSELGGPTWVLDGAVWVADYRKRARPEWTSGHNWLAWQWTGTGRVDGYDGPIDCNVMNAGAVWPRVRNPILGLAEDMARATRSWLGEQLERLT